MPRVHNPDVVRRELARVLIKAHRAITRRTDHSPSELAWLGRTVEALTTIVQDGNTAVRPRLHRLREGKRTRWTREDTVRHEREQTHGQSRLTC